MEAALQAWLRHDMGVEEHRRLAGATADEIRLSKFEPAFLRELFAFMECCPELFDEGAVVTAYHRQAASLPGETSRVDAWALAIHVLLRDAGERHGAADAQLAEVRTGIESVRAILDRVLWSRPVVGEAYTPQPAEAAAYRQMLATLRDDGIFERFCGAFEGRAVRDYCPAVPQAYLMLAQAWRACTGEPPPA